METTKLKCFDDIAEFLDKLKKDQQTNVYQALNNKLIKSLNEKNELTEITCQKNGDKFTDQDHSLKTFLRRIVFEYIKNNADNLGVDINAFKKIGDFTYYDEENFNYCAPTFLDLDTTKAIFNNCKNKLFQDKNSINEDLFGCIAKLCQHTVKKENENKIFPLDLVIYSVNALDYDATFDDIKAIFPFIDMGSTLYGAKNFSKEDIYKFFKKIPLSCFDMFLENQQFVAKLGRIGELKNLLEIEKLENDNDEDAQALAKKLRDEFKKIDFSKAEITKDERQKTGIKIVDDEDSKAKVKRAFMIHQLPKSVASAIVFLFGVGLLFAAGFAWSVPFLLGIGFLLPSIAAFTNSILCMKPTQTRAWLAKIFKNCAWIIDGALLITLGAVFCAGFLAIAFMTFGSLGILMGCFNAFVGTLNSLWDTQRELVDCEKVYLPVVNGGVLDLPVVNGGVDEINNIKSEILSHKIFNLVVFALACVAGVLLALNPAILPIALPFLPGVGIGIAVLSGLGLIKSALRLFYDKNSWQVGCYHAAKYIKAGMFVLGGLALIALPFLPIAATLASVIGMPTLIINIFSLLVGLFSAIKGCMSFRRMSSNIEFRLADQAMDKASAIELDLPGRGDKHWRDKLWGAVTSPLLKSDDIHLDQIDKLCEY